MSNVSCLTNTFISYRYQNCSNTSSVSLENQRSRLKRFGILLEFQFSFSAINFTIIIFQASARKSAPREVQNIFIQLFALQSAKLCVKHVIKTVRTLRQWDDECLLEVSFSFNVCLTLSPPSISSSQLLFSRLLRARVAYL